MAPYLMNHYLRKYLIKIWCVLYYRRHHTFDVKTCFPCTELFSWFQCTQTVFKMNTIIYKNISYLLMNFITWNESWNVQIVYIMVFDVFYIIDEIILLMLKLASNKIDTYLTSLWRHERYLFSVFRGILPAIFGRFSKKLSTTNCI
jgi:hypothetical protein